MHKAVRCFVSKVYHVYKEQVHLTGYAALLGILWAIYSHISNFVDTADANTVAISQHESEIRDLQSWRGSENEVVQRMDYNIQIIAKKIGVEPLKKADGE